MEPCEQPRKLGMIQEAMNQAVAGVAQARKILRDVVAPVLVDMMQIDCTIGIGQATDDTTALVPFPGRYAALPIVIPDAQFFLSLQRRARSVYHAAAAMGTRAFYAGRSVLGTMAPRGMIQGFRAMDAQTLAQMFLLKRFCLDPLLAGTVGTFGFAIRRGFPTASTCPSIGLQDTAHRLLMNTDDTGGLAYFSNVRIDSQDAFAIYSSRSGHSFGSFTARLLMLNCTKYRGRNQYISNANAEEFT